MNNNGYFKTLLDLSPFPTTCQYMNCKKPVCVKRGRPHVPLPKLHHKHGVYHEHGESVYRCEWSCGDGHYGIFEVKNNDCPAAGCPFKREYNIEFFVKQ